MPVTNIRYSDGPYYAKLVLASRSTTTGSTVWTIECRFPRFILAELNTHRVLSRNSASSRAIPVRRRIAQVIENPFIPETFLANKRGMQGGDSLDPAVQTRCREDWLRARDRAVEGAMRLADSGVHKQYANRLLEPFAWHTAVITATDWSGFFKQRYHKDAQPEFQKAAQLIYQVMYDNLVRANAIRSLSPGDWHLPYVTGYEPPEDARDTPSLTDVIRMSAARCARVSYTPFDSDNADPTADLRLYDKLVTADPMHASPLEHVCTPSEQEDRPTGNLRGWHQWRHVMKAARYGGFVECME